MIGKETLKVSVTQQFTLKERIRILFGWCVLMSATVEITAKANVRRKEIEFVQGAVRHQTLLGRPVARQQLAAPRA